MNLQVEKANTDAQPSVLSAPGQGPVVESCWQRRVRALSWVSSSKEGVGHAKESPRIVDQCLRSASASAISAMKVSMVRRTNSAAGSVSSIERASIARSPACLFSGVVLTRLSAPRPLVFQAEHLRVACRRR